MIAAAVGPARHSEVAARLTDVRDRITAACAEVGRDPTEITLIAVVKRFPASDVLTLADLGIADVAENRDQEAVAKLAELGPAADRVNWHFVGQLQRNKCRSVARYAAMVHSVDRVVLVPELAAAAGRYRDAPLDVLLQVSLDADPGRGGAPVEHLDELAAAVAERSELRLRGLMAVAPMDWDPDRAFTALATAADRLRQRYPDATVLSAGMSGDFEAAIRHGATHLRMGSALLGTRPDLG